MSTRIISGTIKHEDNTPWVGGIVRFILQVAFATNSTVYPGDEVMVTLDSNGAFSVVLPVPDSGTAYYRVVMPDERSRGFNLAAGSATDLQTLLVMGGSPVSQDAILTAIGAHAQAANPHPQYVLPLTAPVTYYVRTDGSDANTGLTNTAGGAFLTVQHAVDVVAALNIGIYDVTIQIADGTYVTNQVILKNPVGSGMVYISGNAGNPANVVIDGGFNKSSPGIAFQIQHLKLIKSSSSTNTAISCSGGGKILFGNVNFGSGYTYHIGPSLNGFIIAVSNYAISGAASWSHYNIGSGGLFYAESIAITITNSPAFTVFVSLQDLSVATIKTTTYSGSITGIRYYVSANSVLQTTSANVNYFPGTTPGWTESGGQYL